MLRLIFLAKVLTFVTLHFLIRILPYYPSFIFVVRDHIIIIL